MVGSDASTTWMRPVARSLAASCGLRYGTRAISRLFFLSQPANRKSMAPVVPAQLSLPGCLRVIFDELLHRIDRHGLRHGDHQGEIPAARDRREVALPVGQVGHDIRMRGERRHRRAEQDVIVVRAQERGDGDDAVAARAVLDHHRLVPDFRQAVGEEPHADVGAAAGAERQDQFDRALRPGLRGAGRGSHDTDGQQRARRHRPNSARTTDHRCPR